jgi:hypothetical protein
MDETTRRVLRRALGPVLKLATSTAAIGGLLLFFGFLSQSALYGFAGLPMLTLDPTGLIEAGAAGIVESVGLVLASPARMVILTLFLAAAVALALYRDAGPVRRLLRSPGLCLALQVGLLALLASLLPALIEIAAKGSPVRWEERVRAAEEAQWEARAETPLSPTAEQERVWETTYRLESRLWTPLNWLAGWGNGPAEGPETATAGYGQPLRLARGATGKARQLYGWLFLVTVLMALVVLSLHVWRAHLDSTADSEPSEQDPSAVQRSGPRGRGPARDHVIDTCRRLVEPLLIVAAFLAVALVPAAHGVLAHGGFGHEEVIVRLRAVEECSADAGTGTAGQEAADWSELLAQGGAAPPSPPTECSGEMLDGIDEIQEQYAGALQRLIQTRPEEDEWQARLAEFQGATDFLIDSAAGSGCVIALQRVWQLRPQAAVFRRAPEAAQYFWDRWQEVQAHYSRLRFGYILQYPRGASTDKLPIFETITPQTPLRRGRWALREIRRDCIEETIVVPNPVEAHVRNVLRRVRVRPDSSAFGELGLYPHPLALRTAIELLGERSVSVDRQGVLITLTGTLAGLFHDQEPRLAREAADLLFSILVDIEAPPVHRGSAATALHLVSGPYAAARLVEALDRLGDEGMRSVGTSITAAGFLAQDAWRAHEGQRTALAEPGEEGEDDVYSDMAKRLVDYLRFVAAADDSGVSDRATACSALASTGHPAASEGILLGLEQAVAKRERVALATCITAAGKAKIERARPVLWEIVREPEPWVPAGVSRAALSQLWALGLSSEADLLFEVYLSSDRERAQGAATFLEDADARDMGELLLGCAEDPGRGFEPRRRCLYGLLLVAQFEDGDAGFADRVARLTREAESDEIKETGCMVLRELELRNGLAARFHLEDGLCDGESLVEVLGPHPFRWNRYLELEFGEAEEETYATEDPAYDPFRELLEQLEAGGLEDGSPEA